jgi:hypothetical protein
LCDSVRIGCLNTLAVFYVKAASLHFAWFLICCVHLSFAIRPKKCDYHLRLFDCRSRLRAVLKRRL